MKDPIQPSSTSAALPEPSSTTEFVPGRPGQRFACDNPNKWPNGMISLLMMDGKKMNQDVCPILIVSAIAFNVNIFRAV
jgi:hypothetical protein